MNRIHILKYFEHPLKNSKYLFGILNHKKLPIIGPLKVIIFLTNACNIDCIGCYHKNSLKSKKIDGNSEISFSKISQLISELRDLNTKEIVLSGGGEPFCHPDIIPIIKLIKANNMKCIVTTHGSLIKTDTVEQLIRLKVDELHVSLWSGDSQTYVEVRPKQTEKNFFHIKDWLIHTSRLKEKRRIRYPKIYLINVLVNQNYSNIKRMVEFAEEVKADGIQFRIADLNGFGKRNMDHLKIDSEGKKNLIKELAMIKKNIKIENNLEEFMKAQSFESSKIKYPCYMGWIFSLIKADGSVVPCCGSNLVLGNINNQSFKEIWHSDNYSKFRKAAINKNFNSLTNCSCLHSCTLREYNKVIYHLLNPIGYSLKKIAKKLK